MAKLLILYYSSYGHVEKMAEAIAEGARSTGAQVAVKRVPETVPADIAKQAHFKVDQAAPVATIDELANYDAIIVGTGTRFGRMSSQMAALLDQAGGLWARGALNGKVGAAITSTTTQHGGQEMTLFSFIAKSLPQGIVLAMAKAGGLGGRIADADLLAGSCDPGFASRSVLLGLPYSHQGQMRVDEIVGGAPYGATTIAGSDGSRQPSEIDLAGARHQGELVAKTAAKLFG